MNNLNPIRLLPAREQVSSALRKAILSRELQEGESITLDGISKKLGVSITPVREAFQILARDGLIKLRPNKGAVVLGINEKTIRDHYQTRALLEAETVSLICRNKEDIEAIEQIYLQSEVALEEKNTSDYTYLNQAFHIAIWTASGNNKIKSILSEMWNGLSMGHKDTEESYAFVSTSEHKRILDALKEHNEKEAKERMYRHIIRSMENILTHLES